MAYSSDTHYGIALADRFAAFRADLAAANAKRKVYRTTKNELNSLSDRELNDLGINRTMIKRIALEAAGYE